MGLLNIEQIKVLRSYLNQHGLTYESLQTELLDHICCDMEKYISEGLTFEEAMQKVSSEIPKNQFKKIQTETMEAINKKPSITTLLNYGSLALLIISILLKVLHLPGAGIMLITSFIGMVITIISTLFSNKLIKEKPTGKGAFIIIAIVICIALLSFCFQLLNLPGSNIMRLFSIVMLILSLSAYAIFCYLYPKKASGHLIVNFINQGSSRTEWMLIVLLLVGSVLRFTSADFLSTILFLLIFMYGSVYYFSSSWLIYFQAESKNTYKTLMLVGSIAAFSMLMLPMINGLIPVGLIHTMIWGAMAMVSFGVMIHYISRSSDQYKYVLSFLSMIIALVVISNLVQGSALLGGVYAPFFTELVYNPITLLSIAISGILFFKKPAYRGLAIFTLAMLIFSYNGIGF